MSLEGGMITDTGERKREKNGVHKRLQSYIRLAYQGRVG